MLWMEGSKRFNRKGNEMVNLDSEDTFWLQPLLEREIARLKKKTKKARDGKYVYEDHESLDIFRYIVGLIEKEEAANNKIAEKEA